MRMHGRTRKWRWDHRSFGRNGRSSRRAPSISGHPKCRRASRRTLGVMSVRYRPMSCGPNSRGASVSATVRMTSSTRFVPNHLGYRSQWNACRVAHISLARMDAITWSLHACPSHACTTLLRVHWRQPCCRHCWVRWSSAMIHMPDIYLACHKAEEQTSPPNVNLSRADKQQQCIGPRNHMWPRVARHRTAYAVLTRKPQQYRAVFLTGNAIHPGLQGIFYAQQVPVCAAWRWASFEMTTSGHQ